MREAADAGHRVGDLAGLFSCEIDQLLQGLDSEFRRHGDCQQLLEPKTDCREVARHHQRQVWRLPRHGEEQGESRRVERIAVRLGLRRDRRRYGAGGTGLIHDHDLLLPISAHAIRDDAQTGVDSAAWPGIGNQSYRVIRIIGLCPRRICCHHGKQEQARHLDTPSLHVFLVQAYMPCNRVRATNSWSVANANSESGHWIFQRYNRSHPENA